MARAASDWAQDFISGFTSAGSLLAVPKNKNAPAGTSHSRRTVHCKYQGPCPLCCYCAPFHSPPVLCCADERLHRTFRPLCICDKNACGSYGAIKSWRRDLIAFAWLSHALVLLLIRRGPSVIRIPPSHSSILTTPNSTAQIDFSSTYHYFPCIAIPISESTVRLIHVQALPYNFSDLIIRSQRL